MSPKAERFVSEYLIDLNATQAAIRAGYSKRSAASIGEENLRKPDIAAAVKAGRAKVAETNGMTVAGHLAELQRLRDMAADDGKFSAAVAAETARGKVSGFYVEKVEMQADVRGSVSYKANLPPRS